MIQRTANFITVVEVISEMGLEPTYELASRVDSLMQESYERRCGYPPLKANFITVSEVIREMGLEPTHELVSQAEKMMQEHYEAQCGHPPIKAPETDTHCFGLYLEECRKEIEGFVRKAE
jgi:hypothetical protein